MRGVVRVALYVMGILAMATGVVLVLLGAGLAPAGLIAHPTPWIYRGAMLAFAGVVLALISRSMRSKIPPAPPTA
jgi:hypothetical protein